MIAHALGIVRIFVLDFGVFSDGCEAQKNGTRDMAMMGKKTVKGKPHTKLALHLHENSLSAVIASISSRN